MPEGRQPRRRRGGRPVRPLSELLLLGTMLVVVLPIGWMVVLAFQPDVNIVSPEWDFSFWLGQFSELFGEGETFVAQLVNSLLVVAGTVALCLSVGSLSGYALSQLRPQVPRGLTVPMLAVAGFLPLIPPMALVPGLYSTLNSLGLLGGVPGLILLNTVFNLPFVALLMRVYFDRVPSDLRDSARVDGASEAATFLRVMLPLVRPGLAAVGVFTAIMAWNEFLMGLTMTAGGASAPLTVGIASLVQPFEVLWGQMAAAGTLAAIPIIVLAVIANRQIVAGLTSGAVKG